MDLTSLETTTPQWSVQDVISAFPQNHMTTVAGLECPTADANALAQTIQSFLAAPDSSVLASQMQLMQAVAGNQSGGGQVMLMPPSEALPWMMQQYPMMFLPSQVVPGWTQSVSQTSAESTNATLTTAKEAAAPQTQLPLYAQAVQLQFPDGLNVASQLASSEFQNSSSVAASPTSKLSTSGSPLSVGIAVTPQTVQLVNGAIGITQQASRIHTAQQPASQGDSLAFALPAGYTATRQEANKVELPKPPKKPLSPYMSFSKAIWSQVKGANPSLSVCEVGAAIGRLWRELEDNEKQRYNTAFTNDKVRYDQELRSYLKLTGLQASDLVKPRVKKNHPKPSASVAQQPRPVVNALASLAQTQQSLQQQQQQQTPSKTLIGGGPVETSTITELARALPHFSQVWTGQQQYIDQHVLAQLGHTLFTNSDGTFSFVGVQPQAANVGDDRPLTLIYGQNQELTQPDGNTGQLTTLEKAAVASASSVEDAANQSTANIPWQWHKVQLDGPSSSVQLILPGDQNLGKTLLPKLETDAKLSDAGTTIVAASSQSSTVDVANGRELVESDFSKWKQLQPAVCEAVLEKELHRLRGALSEKTQEAQILMQRLERANRIIEQLRQQRRTMLEQDVAASGSDCKTAEPSIE